MIIFIPTLFLIVIGFIIIDSKIPDTVSNPVLENKAAEQSSRDRINLLIASKDSGVK
ncbi:MAG: hypothetical protein AAGE84_13515 [Cyanobacteria bacterium P01_G01_bin.39]